MSPGAGWATALTVAVLALYELGFALAQRRRPLSLARTAHAALREDWFDAVAAQPGSEILAVQTLRNALMSASMVASTAALGLMGGITLSASSLASHDGSALRLLVELMALALLFAALVTSAMSVRYYNHAGFIAGMPVGCEARRRWHAVGRAHVRRAGVLYSWGVRNLVLVVPVLALLLHPWAGPAAAVVVAAVLWGFDRVDGASHAGEQR